MARKQETQPEVQAQQETGAPAVQLVEAILQHLAEQTKCMQEDMRRHREWMVAEETRRVETAARQVRWERAVVSSSLLQGIMSKRNPTAGDSGECVKMADELLAVIGK